MPKQPLFSTYRTGENRVTASMLAVFERLDLSLLERLLAAVAQEASLTLVTFDNQVAGGRGTVPDASISASFRYLFEVKTTPNALSLTQLQGHLAQLGPGRTGGTFADERLFVVTPDPEQPPVIAQLRDPRVTWCNFLALDTAIQDLLEDPAELLSGQTSLLLRELRALFTHEGLLGHQDVVVVAARLAYDEYLAHHAYVCQPHRAFRPGLSHLGFYRNGVVEPEVPRIQTRWESVVFTPEEADRYAGRDHEPDRWLAKLIRNLLETRQRALGEPYQVFRLSPPGSPPTLTLRQSIQNATRDRNGNPWPWTLGQRYSRLSALQRHPRTTAELADFGG